MVSRPCFCCFKMRRQAAAPGLEIHKTNQMAALSLVLRSDLWQKRYDSGISYKRDRKKYTECEIVDHERGSLYCQQETHHIQQRGRRLFANHSVTSSGSVKPSQIPDTSNHASIHCPAAVLIAFAVGAGLCHMRRPPSCFGSHNTDQRLGCQRGTNR